MKFKTRYRLLMVFIIILLMAAGSLMVFGNSLLPNSENSSGKIMICGGNSI